MATESQVSDKKQLIDRERTNILRHIEQPTILFLCRLTPRFITPDMLTAIGMLGTGLVLAGFILAINNKYFLFLSIFGFAVNWLGDSLDGRIAYFRNIPRKWYGFALDAVMDWLSLVLMSIGYYLYIESDYKILVFTFCSMYGWATIIAQIRYRITDKYTIDAGLLGPTETRVIICGVILAEIFFGGSIRIFSVAVNILLLLINIIDTYKLVQLGDQKDKEIQRLKEQSEQTKS
jgi:phosphatidylglycerophosphate synthase